MQLKCSTYLHAVSSFLLGALVCFSAASCTQDDEGWDDSDVVAVAFTPQLSESALTQTRVVDDKWTGGETVYIHMMDPGQSNLATSGATFNTYTAKTSSPYTSAELTAGTNQTLYYPMNGKGVNFVAYSPAHSSKSTNEVTYSGFADQSTKPKMEAKDFIWCKTTEKEGYNYKSANVPLSFEHRFSKLVITVKRDASVIPADFAKLAITVGSIPDVVKVPLNTGIPGTATGSATLTPYKVTVTADSIVYTAIVPPHTATRTVTFSGVTTPALTHDISDKFDSKYSYTYDFKLAAKSVSMGNVNVSLWNAGSVSWNKDYYLSTEKLFTIPGDVTSGSFLIETNAGTPDYRKTNTANWFTITGVSGTGPNYNLNYTINTANPGMSSRSADIELSAGGVTLSTTLEQQCLIDPLYPTLEIKDANCIIVPPGGHQAFIPVSRVNAFATAYNNTGYNAPIAASTIGTTETGLTAYLLWTDGISDANKSPATKEQVLSPLSTINRVGIIGTGSSAYVYVQSGSLPGNAVVALRNSSGTLLWSWHIWVTSYDPDLERNYRKYKNLKGTENTFMDRNLGATTNQRGSVGSYGLLYQWGRKDPEVGGGRGGVLTSSSTQYFWYNESGDATKTWTRGTSWGYYNIGGQTILYSVQNPLKHIGYTSDTNNDWASTAQNQKSGTYLRWLNTTRKSLDDPCPLGWKVPQGGEDNSTSNNVWSGLTTTNFVWDETDKGRYHSTMGWWPAAGYRNYNSTSLNNVGSNGYCWSSTPNDAGKAYYLNFYSGYVYPDGDSSRAYGRAVRCVPE